jgi:hypothetical protein
MLHIMLTPFKLQSRVVQARSADTVPNDLFAAGLITLDTNTTPVTIVGGISGNVDGKPFAEIFDFPVM